MTQLEIDAYIDDANEQIEIAIAAGNDGEAEMINYDLDQFCAENCS